LLQATGNLTERPQSDDINSMTKVLLIEDDQETAAEIVAELGQRGFVIDHVTDGASGLEMAKTQDWDILIVDRMLPGEDGLSIIEALRREEIRTPALVLSALGRTDDKVRGLRSGGDDYLTKPFALIELSARLEALLRRPSEARATILRIGSLELDLVKRQAWRGQQKLDLLPREFRLLEYLMRREGQTVTRAMLLEDVWNYRFAPQTNLVDVHIGRLRRKIDLADEPSLIASVRGVGFTLRAPH
jgi:two-component system, OmpR family, response regulator